MKRCLGKLLLCLALCSPVHGIPNAIFGDIVQAESPLDGVDLTEQLLAAAAWNDGVALPGRWRAEGRIANVEIAHLLARPRMFGREVLLLRTGRRNGTLESLEATFVDAGSYFGYFQEKLPEGLSRREMQAEVQRRLTGKQAEFASLYTETLEALRASLEKTSGDKRPRLGRMGHSRVLRAEPQEWRMGELTLRLFAGDGRLVRLSIHRTDEVPTDWMDRSLGKTPVRERLGALAQQVARSEDGSVEISGVRPIPQGFQPYCGLNTLAMAARHFGMHLDEDWLAVAGGFQNTGSAQGSNMVRLYSAVAAEAGLRIERKNALDLNVLRRSIDQGLPTIVWRRFSHERNSLHDRFQRELRRNPAATLPDPAAQEERASWPGEDAPLHASIIVGYHADRRELLFLESWSGKDVPRRMRVEEMAATTYLCFVFTP
jgi:hypothetical protein